MTGEAGQYKRDGLATASPVKLWATGYWPAKQSAGLSER